MGQVSGYIPSDDRRLRRRFVGHEVRNVRSMLLKEASASGIGVDREWYQRICCLEVNCETISCNGAPLPFRTHYIELPSLESIPFNPSYLGTVDMAISFRQIPFGQFHYYTGGSFSTKQPAYAIIDNKALLKLPSNLLEVKNLCLFGVLSDPLEDTCVPLTENDPYPIPTNVIHKLELLVIKQLLATVQLQGDEQNTGRDEQAEQRQPRPGNPGNPE